MQQMPHCSEWQRGGRRDSIKNKRELDMGVKQSWSDILVDWSATHCNSLPFAKVYRAREPEMGELRITQCRSATRPVKRHKTGPEPETENTELITENSECPFRVQYRYYSGWLRPYQF